MPSAVRTRLVLFGCFVLFAFSGLCLVFVVSVFELSSVTYFPAYTDMNGTVIMTSHLSG